VFTFLSDGYEVLHGAGPTLFMGFFAYVWLLWAAKALAARRYRPSNGEPGDLATSVIVPVYNESEPVFRWVLASVRANRPAEMVAVVDGGDPHIASIAADYCDRVLQIPKSGKRAAIAAGLAASDPASDVIVVLDSDTVWQQGALTEILRPFEDPRVGGVTPRQAILHVGDSPVRRLADSRGGRSRTAARHSSRPWRDSWNRRSSGYRCT
jgi:hyaluronan synthase